jgi:hypothetical protein
MKMRWPRYTGLRLRAYGPGGPVPLSNFGKVQKHPLTARITEMLTWEASTAGLR